MAERGSFLPEWVRRLMRGDDQGDDQGGDQRLFEEGEKAIYAAKGSGLRAEETQRQAAEEARRRANEKIKEYERSGMNPEDLEKVRKKIDLYRTLSGKK